MANTVKPEIENPKSAKFWVMKLKAAQKFTERWHKRARKYENIYKNNSDADEGAFKDRYNILFSNTETLKPLTLAQLPKTNITRRFLDDDDTARKGSEVMERATEYLLERSRAVDIFKRCNQDALVSGGGFLRIFFDVEIGTIKEFDDETGEETSREVIESGSKNVRFEYIYWRDIFFDKARTWEDVDTIYIRHLMTEEKYKEHFGDKKIGDIPFNFNILQESNAEGDKSERTKNTEQHKDLKAAEIFEIWHRPTKKVYFVNKEKNVVIQEIEDSYNLEKFFPVPRPLFFHLSNDEFIPIAPYETYRSQAEELNMIDKRIRDLIEELKFGGIVGERLSSENAESLLNNLNEWVSGRLPDNTKITDVIWPKPIDMIAKVLEGLYIQKAAIIDNIKEITGISDVVRGNTDARETATAQQLKGNFAVSRIQPMKTAVEFFIRDSIRLMAELIAENFSAEELKEMTGMEVDDELMGLIQQDKLRSYKIDIETDSTVQVDADREKEQRTEFLTALAGASEQLAQLSATGTVPPEAVPILLQFAMSPFKIGRKFEELFTPEKAVNPLEAEVQKRDQIIQQLQEALESKESDQTLQGLKIDADMESKDAQREADSQNKQLDRDHQVTLELIKNQNNQQKTAGNAGN